ncbi:alpha-amylase family glycosyl hydrolase [Vibrio methylphosphonaticus]|uniref:alpha-amylase family glycosyl hydrolase n=1 Tax=Vibrio methylphosphonaticus TaxID=2946866 RepID=UPI00202ABDD0|nr:alpha-amylase family glycosyl hydrolase [Vibrio methylphosphonaticus]MCL9773809.1 alpha-amylase family glycosyl hydrolase [Vibrio methylphosphonaticus]
MNNNNIHLYQIFTRLFGNKTTLNQPWGTIDDNGVGKFSDITPTALTSIRELGMTHVWYTGIPHHALINDYTEFGISNDHPCIVKGRAGSPYAVKDYFSVNPDLADDPAQRNQEFKALIQRTHQAGLKVIIDIVPNHVARHYHGLNNPPGITDFGANDDDTVDYRRDNNFYYLPNQIFQLPDLPESLRPLGGAEDPRMATPFTEYPAKWTGNGSRLAKPNADDWYETVKINYGVKPDGTRDFEALPEAYRHKDCNEHLDFWSDKVVPDSWVKFRDIALYWLSQGVDGFRYDMAEMVPVEFWSYMNASIKAKKTDAFLVAEVYQPHLYRDYIQLGKMDALYDKVDLYDTLKGIMQGKAHTQDISRIQDKLQDIQPHMLHFLDNHDEQRIASPEFVGDPRIAIPAMTLSATISHAPTMLYFGQEVGEAGAENAGFGQPSRTSIFDYIGVPAHQRWMNGGAFDGGSSTEHEIKLRSYYQRLMNVVLQHKAFQGSTTSLEIEQDDRHGDLAGQLYGYLRQYQSDTIICLMNFSHDKESTQCIQLSKHAIDKLPLQAGHYPLNDLLNDTPNVELVVTEQAATINLTLKPLSSYLLKI